MAEVAVRFAVIGLGGLYQAVEQGAGLGPLGCSLEQPVLATEDKGADGVFRHVVVRCHDGSLEIDQQSLPLIEGIADRLAKQPLRPIIMPG